MATENYNENDVRELADDTLDNIVGGAIRKAPNNQWEVIDDTTSQVKKSFNSKAAAMAYAKKNGYGTNIV